MPYIAFNSQGQLHCYTGNAETPSSNAPQQEVDLKINLLSKEIGVEAHEQGKAERLQLEDQVYYVDQKDWDQAVQELASRIPQLKDVWEDNPDHDLSRLNETLSAYSGMQMPVSENLDSSPVELARSESVASSLAEVTDVEIEYPAMPPHLLRSVTDKARTLRLGVDTLVNRVSSGGFVRARGGSQQQVTMVPDEGAVFKRTNPRAAAEEALVADLSMFYSEGALTDVAMNETSVGRFGCVPFVAGKFDEVIPYSSLDPQKRGELRRDLSQDDWNILASYERSLDSAVERAEKNMEELMASDQPVTYTYVIDGEEHHVEGTVSEFTQMIYTNIKRLSAAEDDPKGRVAAFLNSIQATNYRGELEDFKTRMSGSAAMDFGSGSLFKSSTYQYLQKAGSEECASMWWRSMRDQQVRVSDPKGDSEKQIKVSDLAKLIDGAADSGKEVPAIFSHTVNGISLAEHIMLETPLGAAIGHYLQGCPQNSSSEGYFVLDSDSKPHFYAPQLMQKSKFDSVSEVGYKGDTQDPGKGRFSVKPLVENMTLLRSLDRFPEAGVKVLERFTPEAQLRALFTLDTQQCDLHGNNIGLNPLYPEGSKVYQDAKYNLALPARRENGVRQSLLVEMSKDLDLPSHLSVQVTFSDGTRLTRPLHRCLDRGHPSYRQARFSFEVDPREKKGMSLAELQSFDLKYGIDRSSPGLVMVDESGTETDIIVDDDGGLAACLDCPWDLVIFDTDICMVESNYFMTYSGDHFLALRNELLGYDWRDKPLSEEVLQSVKDGTEQIDEAIRWLNKEDSPIRRDMKKYEDATTALNAALAMELNKRKYNYGRTLLKEDGGNYKNLSELRSNFSKAAARNSGHAIWEAIRSTGDEKLIEQVSTQKGRETVAGQLFPRATHRQVKAYTNRVMSRREYIEAYEDLQNLAVEEVDAEEIYADVSDFIVSKYNPLSTKQRGDLSERLFGINPSDEGQRDALLKLREDILEMARPSFFNIACSMYPVLADDFEGTTILQQGDSSEAGRLIGTFTLPLEVVARRLKSSSSGSDVSLGEKISKEIEDSKAAFGA